MRIACLQFAPQQGDIDNNLNRADAVLNRANPQDLDLLVLPELAFSGCNFKSFEAISPYLEHTGSGITSLWARTIALKYGCIVVAGYPEKVDVAKRWPASLEYYNSALAVDADGETIVNYRKSFLDIRDETWASEGPDGFFNGGMRGLGNVALGIGVDINPFKSKAPWMAWEFAYHVLHKQANLIILLMAWLTPQHLSLYSPKSKEPDMDILAYWIARLEPLVRAEDEGEIIVVLTNRCGTEGEATYAGTSCVLGVEDGEVKVYGCLGRGDRDLLVVDTSEPPYYNLVVEPDTEAPKQTTESHNALATEYDRLVDRESGDPETVLEGQGWMGSIDAVLAERTTLPPNQHIYPQNTSSAPIEAEIPLLEGRPGNARSSILVSDSQSPLISTSSTIALSVWKTETLPSAHSRTNPVGRPPVHEEQRVEMVQISPLDVLGLGINGFDDNNPPESASSMKIDTSCESGPSVSGAEGIHQTPIVSSSRRVVPILTKQAVYPQNCGYLPDSGYPSDSAYPFNSAYPPESAFPTDSAYPPESALSPESASSTTVNVPWEREQNRRYYGDEELIKVMKAAALGARNSRHELVRIAQPVVPPMDNQPDSASVPVSAYPPDSAYPPESASSTTVNVPWKLESDKNNYKDKELIRTRRTPSLSGASNSRYESISTPQSFVASLDNPTDSAYLPHSAYPPDSAYPPESAAPMIFNVRWKPQPNRGYYGEGELIKVMEAPAPSGLLNSNHECTVVSQATFSPIDIPPDSTSSSIVNKAYSWEPSVIDSEIGGNTKIRNYGTSTQTYLSPADNSSESASSMRVNISSSRDLCPFDCRTEGSTQTMANMSVETSSGHTSFESTESAASPRENQPESAVSMTVNTDWGPNAAELVASSTNNPPEPAISMIINSVLEPILQHPLVTPTENPPDSARSLMFNIPLVPSPGLFPGEDLVSPIATGKTSSSGHMSFPVGQPTGASGDLLQSPMSDWSKKYSDNSPISPDSASSMLVHQSWGASPIFSTVEELIRITESPSSPVESRSCHPSVPIAERVPPRMERPLSPKLRNASQKGGFQGNSALLFEELVNQREGAPAVAPAEALKACASLHKTPDTMTNTIHGLIPPSYHAEEAIASPHRPLTPSPMTDSAGRVGLHPRGLRGMLRRTVSMVW